MGSLWRRRAWNNDTFPCGCTAWGCSWHYACWLTWACGQSAEELKGSGSGTLPGSWLPPFLKSGSQFFVSFRILIKLFSFHRSFYRLPARVPASVPSGCACIPPPNCITISCPIIRIRSGTWAGCNPPDATARTGFILPHS